MEIIILHFCVQKQLRTQVERARDFGGPDQAASTAKQSVRSDP